MTACACRARGTRWTPFEFPLWACIGVSETGGTARVPLSSLMGLSDRGVHGLDPLVMNLGNVSAQTRGFRRFERFGTKRFFDCCEFTRAIHRLLFVRIKFDQITTTFLGGFFFLPPFPFPFFPPLFFVLCAPRSFSFFFFFAPGVGEGAGGHRNPP